MYQADSNTFWDIAKTVSNEILPFNQTHEQNDDEDDDNQDI